MRTRNLAMLAIAAVLAPATLAASPSTDVAPTAIQDAAAAQQGPRDDADHYEAYFPSGDGVTNLHADVLRPKGMGLDGEPTPVILTVSPYTNHAGSTTEYNPTAEGPHDRFFDFLNLSGALTQGYTYVIVDLPGNGGSGGCNDWGGPVEQGAVKAAVEWAAQQAWSTGKVGLIGKSYDGWTGLMGVAQQPEGLAAVVSMEPVFAGYNYLYNNGVRFTNSVATPALFQAIDAKPGPVTNDPQYNVNGAPMAYCYGVNQGMQQIDDPDDPFWQARNLLLTTPGVEIPLFLTQGFVEVNTKQDAAFDFFNGLGGEHNRAWFGQFDHDRGWDGPSEHTPERHAEAEHADYMTGRKGFVEEAMRFFDLHLKGIEPEVADPRIAVQDNFGRYRAEEAWPPTDAELFTTTLTTGTYVDDGDNAGSGNSAGNGIWTVSQELPHDVWMAGEPRVTFTAEALPRSNFVGNVYDIDPSGKATLVSRGAWLLRGGEAGPTTNRVSFDLYGQDWVFEAGHRIGVLASSANSEWWVHVPTGADVTISDFTIDLPLLTADRGEFIEGEASQRLLTWLASRTLKVPAAAFDNEVEFPLPGPINVGELFLP